MTANGSLMAFSPIMTAWFVPQGFVRPSGQVKPSGRASSDWNTLAEVLFEVFADNENEFAKSGLDGVVDGVVHDGFAVGTQSVQLFQASVAAAHAGCQ